MGDRRTVLSTLATKMGEIAEISTVVRAYLETDFDITQYAMSDLPLMVIPEPAEETEEEMTSQRTIMSLLVKEVIYFLDWAIDPDATLYETLIKKIRDKIGANFKLDGAATETRVMSVSSVLGTMPVYNFVIDLEVRYYLNEQAT